MRVVVKRPFESPEIVNIENTLEAYQSIVEGYIETVSLGPDLMMICNEEGKLNNLTINFILDHDPIVGTVFFTNYNEEDLTDISDANINAIIRSFGIH